MQNEQESTVSSEPNGNLVSLALLSIVVGAGAGLIGALFRLSLTHADALRNSWIVWAHERKLIGFLLVVAVGAAAVACAAWLVRRFAPHTSGSGIPDVEAVLRERLQQPPAIFLIPVKFVGGVLAIGSGLALGREGPSVQMGASVAHLFARIFGCSRLDRLALVAAGAGAGLATAFNAPIAGAIFVLEELFRRFETRMAIAALGASAAAITVARLILGDAPDFRVAPLAYAAPETTLLHLLLGAAAGFLGVVYNRTLLAALAFADGLRRWPVELRAGFIGASVGVLAWFAPALVGGGDPITQHALDGVGSLALLPMLLLLRLALGAVSYAAGTPGGLFAPLLVLGAQLGLFFALFCRLVFPDLDIEPSGFAVVGMAALFAAIVRSPLTGIVLVTEMTANVTMLLPMLGACFFATLVPTLLHNTPIYDSLRERTLRRFSTQQPDAGVQR